MKALICGRGKSLGYYKNLKEQKFDYIYLINNFSVFIRQDPELLSFLQEKARHAKLIQQVNKCVVGMDNHMLQNLPISECYVARCAYVPNSTDWIDDYVDLEAFVKRGVNVKLKVQPPSLRNYHLKFGGNGSLGVGLAHAIVENKCSDITILGFDIYETFYYLDDTGKGESSTWTNENTKPIQDRLKNGMTDLCKEFSDVQFTFYTYSSYNSGLHNCNFIKL